MLHNNPSTLIFASGKFYRRVSEFTRCDVVSSDWLPTNMLLARIFRVEKPREIEDQKGLFCYIRTTLIKETGYEAQQTALFYAFVIAFSLDRTCTNNNRF